MSPRVETPQAPEVLRGQNPTPASDVYAFGIMLFEVWARAEPYREVDGTVDEILEQIADSDIGGARPPPVAPPSLLGVPATMI